MIDSGDNNLNQFNIYAIIFTFFYLLWRTVYPVMSVNAGLDPSWQLGLSWAETKGLQWGKDIIFTYGPLYFINGFVGDTQTLSKIITKSIFINILYFFSVYIICKTFFDNINKKNIVSVLSAIGIFIIMFMNISFISLPDILVTSSLIMIYKIFFDYMNLENLKGKILIILNSFWFGILTLYKLSYVFLSVAILMIMFMMLINSRRFKDILYVLGSYITSVLLMWILMKQNITNLIAYFVNGIDIAKGYCESMQSFNIQQTFTIHYFEVILLILFSIISFYYLIKKQYKEFISIFIVLPVLFLAFKESFVRDDLHYYAFFSQLIGVVLYILFLNINCVKKFLYIKMYIITGIMLITFSIIKPNFLPNFDWYKFVSYVGIKKNVTIENNKNSLKNYYKLGSNFKADIKDNKSIDIIPWDISLLYAYNYNWNPRPIFQSYSAYTAKLDSLNSDHFAGSKSPEQVLYAFNSIDNRYPIFDEPKVFQNLIKNYKVLDRQGNEWLLLGKNDNQKSRSLNAISSKNVKLNEVFSVPQVKNSHVFCKVNVQFNAFGKIMNLFFKTTPLYMDFYLKGNNKPIRMRILRDNGNNGFFISRFAKNVTDVENILNERYIQNIDKVSIVGRNIFYKNNISVKFLSMPFRNKFSNSMKK